LKVDTAQSDSSVLHRDLDHAVRARRRPDVDALHGAIGPFHRVDAVRDEVEQHLLQFDPVPADGGDVDGGCDDDDRDIRRALERLLGSTMARIVSESRVGIAGETWKDTPTPTSVSVQTS
jgi:hypothetical protein